MQKTATMLNMKPRARPVAAVVRALSGSAKPGTHHLVEGSCFIGSGSQNTIIIENDPTVSRAHAELRLAPEGIFVRDLGSRNGTYYSGQRVGEMTLPLGGEIQIGQTRFALVADLDELAQGIPSATESFRGLVGRSPVMRQLFSTLTRLEGASINVVLLGESGVGKELVARAIHEGSSAASGPYVAINCGAVQKDLIASQLFGHKKGAFTGALDSRKGAFVQANGGTLFLDEIGELPIELQPLLLRALETGEVTPVGSDEPVQVKVRVVSATNRDLMKEIESGAFREDLYYRLAVVPLVIPPLRERREDIAFLAQYFARQEGMVELPADVIADLESRSWRGNVRELRNAVQAYAALGMLPQDSRRANLLEAALESEIDLEKPYHEQKELFAERFQRLYLKALLRSTGGNQTAAAKISGLDRAYISRLAQKLGFR